MSAFANTLSNSVFGSKFLSELQEFTSNATGVVSHILPVTQTKQEGTHDLNSWVYEQINTFLSLDYDYDGEESEVPTIATVEYSLMVADLLSRHNYEIFGAAPTPDGSIEITAEKNYPTISILIEIFEEDCKVYAKENGKFKYVIPFDHFRF